jgi:hypothetical protein
MGRKYSLAQAPEIAMPVSFASQEPRFKTHRSCMRLRAFPATVDSIRTKDSTTQAIVAWLSLDVVRTRLNLRKLLSLLDSLILLRLKRRFRL